MTSETHNVEFKQSWQEDNLKVVCGFANAEGGTLFIGRDDAGHVIGLNNAKRQLEDIPNKIKNVLGVMVEVKLLREGEKNVIAVAVQPYSVPISLRGRYYFRSGSTTQELTGTALNDFLLKKLGRTWDDVIEDRATFEDIDERSVKTFLRKAAEAERMPDDTDLPIPLLFEKLNIAEGGKLKRAAIVLFGKNPSRFYTGLSVRIGRFGVNDADLRFQESEEGNIIYLLDAVLRQLDHKFLIRNIRFEGLQRIETCQYPMPALREMLLNALIHRTYFGVHTQIRVWDDRLSIWNDGGLPDGMTMEMLNTVHPSRPRNRLLAEVAFKGGFIDAWGRGISKITEACSAAGLPAPVLQEYAGGFMSELRLPETATQVTPEVTPEVAPEVTPEVLRMLAVLDGELTRTQIQEKLGLTDEKHFRQNYQQVAVRLDLIEMTIPDKPNSRLQKYRLTGKGRQVLEGRDTRRASEKTEP